MWDFSEAACRWEKYWISKMLIDGFGLKFDIERSCK